MKYLIINTGSASKKYAVYEGRQKLYQAHFELEAGNFVVEESFGEQKKKTAIAEKIYTKAQAYLLNSLLEKNIIQAREDISAIGTEMKRFTQTSLSLRHKNCCPKC